MSKYSQKHDIAPDAQEKKAYWTEKLGKKKAQKQKHKGKKNK